MRKCSFNIIHRGCERTQTFSVHNIDKVVLLSCFSSRLSFELTIATSLVHARKMSSQPAKTTSHSPPEIQSLYPFRQFILQLRITLVSVDQWSKFAKAMASSTADGPTTWSARHLLNHANSTLPFSSATSILDVGCGTGKVMQVLLTEHDTSISDSITLTASDIAPGMVEALGRYRAEQISSGVPHWDQVQVLVSQGMRILPNYYSSVERYS